MSEFLYPFLERDAAVAATLLGDLAASARSKAADSDTLRSNTLDCQRTQLEAVAAAMADRFGRGGRLFTFGNGGSSTDAASMAAVFSSPPWGNSCPACTLAGDSAVITALGNDVGFELVFSRQLIACAKAGDIAIGISTSGLAKSPRRLPRGDVVDVLTIGLAGYDGGHMGHSDEVEHCFVVSSESVHRIQEAQGALAFALWSAAQDCLAGVGGQRG